MGADACESPSRVIREGNAIRLWILVSQSAVCPQQGWAGDVAAQEQVCFVCPGLSNKHVGMCFGALVTCHSAWVIFKCKLTSLLRPVDGGAGSSFPLLSVTYRRAKADKLHFCPEQTLDMWCPLWKPSISVTEKLQLLPPADPARLADSTNFSSQNWICRYKGAWNSFHSASPAVVLAARLPRSAGVMPPMPPGS